MRARSMVLGLVLGITALSAAPAMASVPATVLQSTSLGSAGFGSLAVDDAGQHVFVSQPAGNDVEVYDFQGNLLTTIQSVYGASGMTINSGELYIAESTTGTIVQIPLANLSQAPSTVGSGLVDPTGLVYTGGKLWAAEQNTGSGVGWGNVASMDPGTGAVVTLSGSFYDPDLAVSAGDPNTLFVAQDGLSPGSISRYDVSGATPTLVAANTATNQENIKGLAVSPDGTRVIPASGYPYEFGELDSSTLTPDGLVYPGAAYPAAVAVSDSGMLATGLFGGNSPNIAVYPLGTPSASFTATITAGGAAADVVSHGLALSAHSTRLFAVTDQLGVTGSDAFAALQLYSPPSATITSPASGGTYAVGQNVATAFSCTDSQGPGISSCVDSNGGSGSGGQLDTAAAGTHTYTVTATSTDGARSLAKITYTVAAAPSVSITAPASNATYLQSQAVNASYSCQDGAYGPGITVGGCTGSVGNGSPIDTTTPGSHSFTVTARSGDGQSATQTVSYTVVAPTADLSVAITGATQAASNSSFSETLTVRNLGPDTASNVASTMTVPSNVQVTNSGGGSIAGGQVRWTQGSLASGATVTYTVTFRVGSHTNGTAAIAGSVSSATADPNPANNSATVSVALGKSK